jgi:hypothetical protein
VAFTSRSLVETITIASIDGKAKGVAVAETNHRDYFIPLTKLLAVFTDSECR